MIFAKPTRRPNAELRAREHLTPGEVDTLIEAAKANRHGHRDATMILLAFRHGCERPRSAICAGISAEKGGPVLILTGSMQAN